MAVSWNWIQEVKIDGTALKSPYVPPFFKGGISLQEFEPLFGKEGKARFWRSGEGII
jgi:hypothetical protein